MNKPVLCYYGLFEDATAGRKRARIMAGALCAPTRSIIQAMRLCLFFHGTISDNRPEYDRRPRSFEWLVFKSDNPRADAARLCRSLAAPVGATLSLLEQIRGMRANIAPQPLL